MKKFYLALLISFLSFAGYAQTARSYSFVNTTGSFSTISGTGTQVTGGIVSDDGVTTGVPIGFTFTFCGSNYTTGSMSANGVFSLQSTSAASCCTITASNMAGGGAAGGWLMPFWMDMYGTGVASPTAWYQTTGSSGSRVLTVEWRNWNTYSQRSSNPGAATNFQVKLYEGTNVIEFVYGSFSNSPGTSAVIGIANSQSDYQTIPSASSSTPNTSFNTSCSFPSNGTVLRWSPCTQTIAGGTTPICVAANATLVGSPSGGTWASSGSGVASVNSGGIVTGVSAGNANITYTATCGLVSGTAVKEVTVNAAPAAPGGNTPLNACSSITLTNSSGSGTWISGTPSVATVGSTSGIVTGVAAGSANISFTLTSSGCTSVAVATVNALPAISGSSSVCTGSTITLTHTTSGGTWTSSNTTLATVGSVSGVVSGSSSGTVNITYTVPGGCFVTKSVVVSQSPSTIGGSGSICGGTGATSTTLTNSVSGGLWTSSAPSQATVGSTTGVVTGVASGAPVITYTLSSGCFATKIMSVSAVAPITGPSSVCLGNTITLADATSGGTWSSSNTSVATINSSGVVTGIALGSTNITYNVISLGCFATTVINATNPPSTFSVTGGGAYCSGGTGVHIGLNNSNSGITYVLYNGATPAATATGTGAAVDFGLFTASGTYTVVANPGTTCAANMSGSAVVSVNSLPTAFTVGGGGAYCSGGTGVNITLSSSTVGVNYQLMLNGTTPVGSPMVGTSFAMSFGPVTSAGTYTVIATNATTGCINNMSGSATVSINPLPTAHGVCGGGDFCLGGSGVTVYCCWSDIGIQYQLFLAGSPVGSPIAGTGSAISFGLITTGGLYSIQATNTATGCVNMLSGTATVVVNPLPTVFTVTGGGAYCLGGTGVAVGLNGSTVGVNYQLFIGTSPVATPVPGTGTAISFGLQTTLGSYTVVATNATTGCVNSMFGSVAVTNNPLPTVFTVTGGGGYCAGGAGIAVGLSGSTVGTTYQLFWNGTLVGAASGTGSAISFGLQLAAGTYTVVGTNTGTGCVGNMSGSVVVVINPTPAVFTVSGGGNYCSGSAGLTISLSGSETGVNYQLYNGATATGSVMTGTGGTLTFPAQTAAGSYTVRATNATTTCTSNMTGSAVIIVDPLPTVYAITGGGNFCSGGVGVHVGLAASNSGIDYQLMNGGGPVGPVMPGTGFALDFGLITTANTYTIQATNTVTGCQSNMSGSAVVGINSLPTAYNVTGGGNYCAGTGGIALGLDNSATGVNYQLYNGASPVGASVAGTGAAISFGMKTAAGVYMVVATTAATGCSDNMLGSATIAIDPIPGVFVITGGGNYCSGGTGVNVGLSGSASGIDYQLMNGMATVGAAVPGTGGAISFGLQTAAGSYTVVATDAVTGCTNSMTGTVTVNINPLPTLYTTTGGGDYCAGGTGVSVGLSGSSIGISYQLLNGGVPSGAPMPGTGLALNFGLRTAAGSYTIVGTNTTTGCAATMTDGANIIVNALPPVNNVTGGGSYCLGGTGVSIGLDGSATGFDYQLYNGVVAVGSPIPGSTGLALDFGMQTAVGIYTVKATDAVTGCVGNMTGSAVVGTYPLPVVYNITGGGNFCSGGTGVNVGLSGSNIGVSYQLMIGAVPIGASVPGTGTVISFGAQTAPGVYTVEATNDITFCPKTMNGTANVGIHPLPTQYNITGGGNYCAGGTGVMIGIDGSDVGTHYQLMNGVTAVGAPKPGTGLAISFGPQTVTGSYTVVATTIATTCMNIMAGSVNVNIDPLPTAYNVMGGGNYCSGGTGVNITLDNSDLGIEYQLMNGTMAVGSPMPGSGTFIDFGMQTGAGVYTIIATDMVTGCTNTMTGTATVVINLLPTTYIVGGGGSYCAGGTGLHITLSGSNAGISYQLMNGIDPVGGWIPGTGMALDFGLQTAGGVYTVVGRNNTTLCTNNMTGSATIVVNPLPTVYPVSSTSSTYCAGGGGVNIWINTSDMGINYQLYVGSTMIGLPKPGTGSSVDFGYFFVPGSYTIVGTNASTGCTNAMSSSVTIVVNPLPTVYTITGGGSYCSGGTGVNIGLSGSNSGISYQLMNGIMTVGSPVSGTGSAISFGSHTAIGAYTVVATNVATTCTSNMSGTANVSINALPAEFTVLGGGNYCAGGTGVNVTLSGSATGINYQLYRNVTIPVGSAMAGTGAALNFGAQTGVGSYHVVAMNAMTGCSSTMISTASVATDPLPTLYSVVGGGNYCPGGTGVHVGISGSDMFIGYQLYRDGSAVGSSVTGTGTSIDFGLQTVTGSYTVKATNGVTGCVNNMSGSAAVGINSLPTAYSVIGGGNYCAGGAGLHVGLSNSTVGVNYTLYAGTLATGTMSGTGAPIDFGLQTAAGIYTVVATNTSTTCQSNMTGSVTININPVVTPSVSISTSTGTTVCEGNFVTFTATAVNGGSGAAYQWMVNGTPSAVGVSYGYAPSNGDVVTVMLTSSMACAMPATVNSSVTMTVDPSQLPVVAVSVNPGTTVCQGTSVTYEATPTYGGSGPTYTWVVNGVNVGTASTYTYIPANGDVVYARMTSDYHCRLANTAISSNVDMQVDVPVLPIVTITANPGLNVGAGQSVTFNATVANGGSSPSYQWLVNGVAVAGANAPSYTTSNLANRDSVTCLVQSSSACAGLEGFNSVRVRVYGVGVQQIGSVASDIRLVPNPSKGIFTVKGTIGSATDEEVTMEVTNMLGQVVYNATAQVRNGELNELIELQGNIANGMYILNLRSGGEQKVFHMVIEK